MLLVKVFHHSNRNPTKISPGAPFLGLALLHLPPPLIGAASLTHWPAAPHSGQESVSPFKWQVTLQSLSGYQQIVGPLITNEGRPHRAGTAPVPLHVHAHARACTHMHVRIHTCTHACTHTCLPYLLPPLARASAPAPNPQQTSSEKGAPSPFIFMTHNLH